MKRSVVALFLCVTAAACSTASSGAQPSAPSSSAAPHTLADVATVLASSDGHPRQWSRYVKPLHTLVKRCAETAEAVAVGVLDPTASAISTAAIPATRLDVASALAALPKPRSTAGCRREAASYAAEVVGTGPAKAAAGWGGYAGSVTAWNAVHKPDRARPGGYLPRRGRLDAYEVLSAGQVSSLIERFDPPISAKFALAQVVRDLLPGKVHSAYTLRTGQCQQAIYLGPALGGLLHNSALGAFVELSSGGGVGHTRYDPLQVDRARITPLGAIGGEPCT